MSDEMNNVGATPATEPSTGSQDAPLLIFSDDAGNQINEISLAPGEQKKIKVVLSNHPEGITQNFLAQWSVYDPNHQLTSGISCVMDSDGKKWLNPLYLSTTDESVGGMSGNDLNSARMGNGVWRCMGKNPNGQFWYPRDMYIPPVPVAEFVLMASSDWTDKYATFELDNNVTKFVMTTETGTPAANGTTVTCNYSMKLTINNANASNVAPPQENNDGQVTPPPQENGGGQVTPAPQNNDGETVPPQEDNAPDESITTFEGKPLVSKVKLDIAIKTTGINQKTLKVKFIFNTFRLKKDANGKFIKEQGRTHVIDEQLYYCLSNPNKIQHDIRSLPLEEGEYLEDASIAMLSYYRLVGATTDWKKCIFTPSNGLLDASSGEIDLIFDGVIYTGKGAYLSKNSPSQIIGELPASIAEEENKRREEEKKRREEQARKAKEEEDRKKKEEEERLKKEEEERLKKEEEEAKNKDANRRKAIREGLRSVNVDAKTVLLNDTLYNEARAADESFVVCSGQCYQLTNVNTPINQESKDVVGKDIGGIYPGSIVIADKNLSEGNPIPLANVARSQTQIYGTFFSGKGTLKTVDASNAGNVHDQIGAMLRELFSNSQYMPAGDFDFSSDIYSSKYDMMFNMGVDATFCGSNVKVNATINNNESTFIQDTWIKQSFFTVRLNDNYRDDVSKLFADKETWDNIKEQCTINGKVQPLAIITSVTYGRNVHYLKEFSTKSFTYNGDQSHTGHGVDVSLKQEIAKSSEATKAQIVSVGDFASGSKMMAGNQTESEIHTALKDTSTFGPGNQGAPIAYSIELISGGAPGTIISPTFNGNYVVSEYKRCPSSVSVKVLMKAWTLGDQGNVRLTFKFDTFTLAKDSNGNYYKGPGRKGVTWDHRYADHNYYDNGELPLEPNEYVDGYVKMKIESRPHNAAGWETHQDFASIDASSGIIDLTITGTSRLGASDKPHIDDSSTTKYI